MQLQSAIVAEKALDNIKSFEELKKALEKMYYYLQCSLKENLKDIVDFLKPLNFILVGKRFLSCAEVAFSTEIDFSPYLCPVDESYNLKFCELFKTVGVRQCFDVHDYIKTLKEVKHNYEENPISIELSKVVTVLTLLSEEMVKTNVTTSEAKAKYQRIFIPDSKGIMKPSTEVCVKDCIWMPDEKGVVYANENIPPKVCIKLGANTRRQETLRKHTLGIPFGQKEKLTNRLKRILKGYPCDKSVMKELLQNADDAQATKICFINDPRHHPDERVFEECWKPLQGPALCVYNDAPFTKKDIEGIQNLGEGSKGDDPNKTGQYGVGFNAVYHLTDVPTFISQGDEIGEVLCAFDPNLKFASGADESKPGVMYDNISYLKEIFTDVFPCYLGEHFPINNGTMFRFPLRNKEMAKESKICDTSITQENLDNLLDSFKKEMVEVLLFVNNVKEVYLYEIEKITGCLVEKYNVKASISQEDEEKRKEFAAHVSKIGRGLQNGELSIADVPVHEVSYVLDLEDKEGQFQKWFVVQRIGFESAGGIPDIVDKAFKKGDLGLLPRGGVASLITSSETKPPGKAFCFLPLPFETGLPVHINGHFALDHEARRSLWRDDKGDYRSSWNNTLLRQVVAPCYVTLLDEVRQLISLSVEGNRTYLNCSQKEAEKLIDSRYTILFPFFPTRDLYWETLAKEVYHYMDAKVIRLLPVLRQSEEQSGFCIEWLPPTGQGIDKAFFGNLTQELPKDFEILDDNRKDIEKKKSRSLTDTLLAVGFNLVCMPMRIYQLFKDSSVDSNVVSAKEVILFFATYKSHNQLCKIGTLPSHIGNTPFKSVFNLRTVLKYCKEYENFFTLLHGLPLLLTQDKVLRVFNRSFPVFQSGYYMLLPNSSSSFLHHEVYSYIFPLRKDDTVTSAVFKMFDIAAFGSLLPKELDKDDYQTTNKYISWKPDDEQISSNWIWHVWRFLSNFLEKTLKELDERQKQCDQNKRVYCELKYEEKKRMEQQQHLKNITEKKLLIQEALAPVINWCLVPATVQEKSPDNFSNVKSFLVPLAMVETVICFEEVPFLLSSLLLDILGKMALPELNCKVLDDYYKITKQLVANLSNPCSVLSVLLHKLEVDPKSMDGLDKFDCSHVLQYFNDKIFLLDSKDAKALRILPFYTTIHGKSICIKEMQGIVLSDSIPKDDMDIWQKQSMIVFLKENTLLKELYSFLGCDSKDAIDLYCDIIFEKFHEMSENARLSHLKFLRHVVMDKSPTDFCASREKENIRKKNKERLLEELRKLKFIPDCQGTLKTASAFYDPSNELFAALFESKKEVFPPVPFCEKNEWLPFLRTIGLVHQVTHEQFVQFAKEVETEAKVKPCEATKKKSDVLIKCIMEHENVATNHLLNDIKEIRFIFPLRVSSCLQDLHKQYGMKQNISPYICFKGSVASVDTSIAWTSASFLPPNANPFYQVRNQDHKKIFQQLGILENPTVNMVVSHCQNLCKVLTQRTLTENPPDGTKEREKYRQDSTLILKVMTGIYDYLETNYHDNEDAINELKDIRCLVVDQGKYFVYPCQVALDIMSEKEIKPYLYKIPNEVAAYAELFEKLGATNTVTASQYSMVLKNIHDECGSEKLHPNEILNAFKATKGLFETIGRMQNDQAAEIPALYLPGEKINESEILVFLQRSTEIVFNDAPNFKERVKCFEKLLLVKLQKCGLEASNDELLVKKLPLSIRPRMLTSLVQERLVEGKQAISCSSAAQELREILTSGEFCHGMIRMIRHSNYDNDVNISSDILTTVRQRLSCIFVYSVSNLRTRLVCNGETIPESEANVSCFGEKEEGELETWKIYVADGADLKKYFSRVAIIVDRMTDSLLGKDMLIHLPILLSIMPCEIKSFLDDLGVREDNILEQEPPSYLPSAGKFIHIADHHLLVDAFGVFSPGDYVGYELDDPSLRGEDGIPTYIYAVVIEEIIDEGQASSIEPSLRKYRIDIGKDKEPIIVDAADLYMFKRNKCLELKVYCGPSSDKAKQSDNLGEILNQITRILEEAWKLPEDKRRKIIKRLILTWHPDKNPGNEEFCNKIFQFIQGKIEKLEKGTSFGTWRASTYRYRGSYGSFFKFWGCRARNHRSQSSSFYGGGGFSTFSWASYRRNPQPGEARRWYNQAKADLDAASNDIHYQRPSYEWACFKCHQSAEKALKAAQYSKDADKTSTHSLTALAQELNSSTLLGLASDLELVVGNSMRMRYPDQIMPPGIPHDAYDKKSASRAMEIASSIIREVESEFLR